MATQQDPHRDLIELAWKVLYAGKTIEVHPLATTTTFTSTADTSSGALLNATPTVAYTKGEFTVPANAVPIFNTSTRIYPSGIYYHGGQCHHLSANF